ncbi:ABC transporter permease, partial [Micromonospora noduli]
MPVKRTSPRSSQLWSSAGLPVLGAVLAVALWWLATRVFNIEPFFLPAPPDVVDAFFRLPAYLLSEAWVTFLETVTGFGIAAAGGLAIAIVLAASRTIE